MPGIENWTEDTLRALIADGVQESLTLDYKRSDALARTDARKTEISKDVSAFANSAGGRIVYGIIEDQHLPVALDEGSDPEQITREWLEQVIDSTISPRVQGLTIKAIPLENGRMAFAVDVPAATSLAPHQANDRRYYKRTNFKSEPMYDYEVRDVSRRAMVPALFAEIRWSDVERTNEGRLTATMDIIGGNRSDEPALYSNLGVAIENTGLTVLSSSLAKSGSARFADDPALPTDYYTRHMMVPNHAPLYKERVWHLGEIRIAFDPGQSFRYAVMLTCPGCSFTREARCRERDGEIIEEKLR